MSREGDRQSNNGSGAFRFSSLGGESVASEELVSGRASYHRGSPPTAATSTSPRAHQQNHQQSISTGTSPVVAASSSPTNNKQQAETRTTSSSQRLSSIDILNENRQRQLKLKEQESFKQHLEQRQKIIKQQQQASSIKQQSEDNNNSGEQFDDDDSTNNLGVTYQVNTSAPDYMARAVQAASAADIGRKGYIAVNPFDEEAAIKMMKEPSTAAVVSPPCGKTSTVAGFLSSLGAESSVKGAANEDELMSTSKRMLEDARKQQQQQQQQGTTRYAKVLEEGKTSYNYDDDPSKKPFYKKDFATLLQESRGSPNLVILIVAIALLLDNMLLTSVVPIIPAYLYKLRIERQHRDLLEREPMSVNNKSSPGWRNYASGALAGSDSIDREEELARRINQSLAAAKDRFSGSVFHPRVKTKLMKLSSPKGEAINDDDDDGDDGATDGRDKEEPSGGQRREFGTDDDRKQQRRRKLRKMQDGSGDYGRGNGDHLRSRKKQENVDTNDDDDGDDDDDENNDGDQSDNKEDNDAESEVSQQQQQRQSRGGSRNANRRPMRESGAGRDLPEDDDEDRDDMARWSKLRDSLVAMARRGKNDTDQLGGMCLSMVMNPKSPNMSPIDNRDDDDDDVPDNTTIEQPKKQRANQSKEKSNKEKVRPGPLRKMIKPKNKQQQQQQKVKDEDEARKSQQKPMKDGEQLVISHQDIVDESLEVGVMFASKPIVQAFANPFIGTLTNRVGFTIPMFTGFVIMFLSTLVFAFGSTYSTLFIARAIQGVGSACTSVAGMSMLADRFPDDAERGQAMSIALGGLALGVVIGPPFGGFMYEFVGKASPFIVLSILALLDGLLQLLVLQPRVTENQEEGASLMTLIKDPYILVAAGAITFANTGIAILEPALPLWMMDTMQATNWEQGVAFLPAALSYMFGTNFSGNLGLKIGRWRATLIGLVVIGCSLLLIPFATRVDHLIIPNGAIGFAMGMVDSSMMPMLGYLVDIRHTSVYGSVYAIGDVAFCASFAFGPALSGTLVELIGFEGLIITTALICFAFAPLLLLLRNPPARQVNEAQLHEQSLRYVNYNQLDSPDEEAQLTGGTAISKTYVR